ncbi:MAG TPA: PEP-CTERM sorting domain-containing protein [Gemmataceae bacterium]|nr:PEP-CTERM sorting domain-containing protein [Gemmataceae bacterium]
MKKHLLSALIAAGFILRWSGNASADPLPASDAFTLGQINKIHDNDAEVVYAPNGSGGYTQVGSTTNLAVGDVLLAVVQWTEPGIATNDPEPNKAWNGVTYNEMTGVSLLQISSITDSGTTFPGSTVEAYNYTFVSPTSNAWTALTGLTGVPTGTTLVTYNNTANGYTTTSGSISTDIASAVTGTLMWDMGFTGTVTGTGANATVAPNFAVGENWVATAPLTEAGFAGLVTTTQSTFNGALSVTGYGPDGILLGLTGNNFGATSPGQFNSSGQLVAPATGTGIQTQFQVSGTLTSTTSDFGVASNTNGFVNPLAVTPEPSSFVLLSLGAGLLGIGTRIRRRLLGRVQE